MQQRKLEETLRVQRMDVGKELKEPDAAYCNWKDGILIISRLFRIRADSNSAKEWRKGWSRKNITICASAAFPNNL
jgi:hypothetical protein